MTNEEKMKAIVTAAGECWHEYVEEIGQAMGHYYSVCTSCGLDDRVDDNLPINPSPTDLNELFRLASRLGIQVSITTNYHGCGMISCWCYPRETNYGNSRAVLDTTHEALLDALYNSIKGDSSDGMGKLPD
jgi:hypothetical protein